MESQHSLIIKGIISILIFILLFAGAWVFDHNTFRFHFIDNDQEPLSDQPMIFQPLSNDSSPEEESLYNLREEEAPSTNKLIVPHYKPREYIRIYRD